LVSESSDDGINNTGIKKKRNTIKKKTRLRNLVQFSLLIKVLELFLRCPVLVLVSKQKLCSGLTR
jgi:hypothetical protein